MVHLQNKALKYILEKNMVMPNLNILYSIITNMVLNLQKPLTEFIFETVHTIQPFLVITTITKQEFMYDSGFHRILN